MHPDKVFILVNDVRVSLSELATMNSAGIKTIDARGCTALDKLDAPNAKSIDASGCTALDKLDAPNAKSIYARGCTALDKLDAPNAETIDASGCTALDKLDAPNAKSIYARGCTALDKLDAPNAEYIDARGCTALDKLDAPNAEIKRGPYCFAGVDARGYVFEGMPIRGQWRVLAGCRNFSIYDARKHWGHGGPSDRPDCLALVEKIAAAVAEQGAGL